MVGIAMVPDWEYETKHDAEALLPVKTQLAPLKLLVTTLLVKLTEPEGVMVPGDMSSTVAVHTVF